MESTKVVHTVVKLTPAVYNDLEKKLAANLRYSPKNDIDAAYRCGVNDVLLLLRQGLVE